MLRLFCTHRESVVWMNACNIHIVSHDDHQNGQLSLNSYDSFHFMLLFNRKGKLRTKCSFKLQSVGSAFAESWLFNQQIDNEPHKIMHTIPIFRSINFSTKRPNQVHANQFVVLFFFCSSQDRKNVC